MKATKEPAVRSVFVTGVVPVSALLIAVFTLGTSRADPPSASADDGTDSAMESGQPHAQGATS